MTRTSDSLYKVSQFFGRCEDAMLNDYLDQDDEEFPAAWIDKNFAWHSLETGRIISRDTARELVGDWEFDGEERRMQQKNKMERTNNAYTQIG